MDIINNNICSGVYDGRNYCVDLSTIQPINLEDIKNESTVYGISGIWSNISINSSLYLGSSVETRHRIVSNHINYLNKNKHENIHLQHVFNKHGIEEFKFFIFEKCEKGQELIREQNWLDFYNDNHTNKSLFNIAKIADKPILTQKGREKCNKYIDENFAMDWIVTNPKGKELKIHSLKRFCEKNSLITNAMYMVAKGEISQHAGWKCRYASDEKPRYVNKIYLRTMKRVKDWLVTFPSGKTMKIRNLEKFCRENNLRSSGMLNVVSGRSKTHKGFKCQRM